MKTNKFKETNPVEQKPQISISNCNFQSGDVVWDAKAIEAVTNVSKELLNLTEMFKTQKIETTMIQVQTSPKIKL